MRALNRLDRLVRGLETAVLSGSILLMAALSIANVIGRNLFDESLAFASELSRVLLVLVTFLGIGYGARCARHIRMSAFYDPLPPLGRKLLMVLTSLVTAALLLLLAWYALEYVRTSATIGRVTPSLQLPLYVVYAVVPIGFVLGALQYLLTVVRNLTTAGVHLAYGVPEDAPPAIDPAAQAE